MKYLLVNYQSINNIITYVKNKGTKSKHSSYALTNIVKSCAPLHLSSPFVTHVLAMAYHKSTNATNDIKIGIGMKKMNMVEAQNALHKIITWMKKSRKGRQEWELV